MGNLLSYPGGKSRGPHVQFIRRLLARKWAKNSARYHGLAEPFCGSAAVTWWLLKNHRTPNIWLNDLDKGVVKFWQFLSGSGLPAFRTLTEVRVRTIRQRSGTSGLPIASAVNCATTG
jgi:hypothetical protein